MIDLNRIYVASVLFFFTFDYCCSFRPKTILSKKNPQKMKARTKQAPPNQVTSASELENKLRIQSVVWIKCNIVFLFQRLQPSYKKEDKKSDKISEKDKDFSKKQETKSGKSESVSSNKGPDPFKKDERKHGRRSFLNVVLK